MAYSDFDAGYAVGRLDTKIEFESEIIALKAEVERLKISSPDAWPKSAIDAQLKLQGKRDRYRAAIEKAIMRLGAPTMGYEPMIELREIKDSNEEAARVLQAALAVEKDVHKDDGKHVCEDCGPGGKG